MTNFPACKGLTDFGMFESDDEKYRTSSKSVASVLLDMSQTTDITCHKQLTSLEHVSCIVKCKIDKHIWWKSSMI